MMAPADKRRLDILLVERGLIGSREQGRRLIMAGEVLVDGRPVTKPGTPVSSDAVVWLKERPRFASRGGEKLATALEQFGIDPSGWVCADVGASTGGFTDCLLQAGAVRVYAIDVGYGQLAWALRHDPRVVVMERVNARYLESLPEPVDFASIDVSFISLCLILPSVRKWLIPGGQAVALVKPQFEAGPADVQKGGVVRDPNVHRRVLEGVIHAAQGEAFAMRGLIPSPVRGPAGNVEFLLWLATDPPHTEIDVAAQIETAIREAHAKP